MAHQQEAKQPITIVTACMQVDGFPTFALTEVEVTAEERAEGAHYYLAQTELLERGFEEPFVHFDSFEAPTFLHPAVKDFLADSEPIVLNAAS